MIGYQEQLPALVVDRAQFLHSSSTRLAGRSDRTPAIARCSFAIERDSNRTQQCSRALATNFSSVTLGNPYCKASDMARGLPNVE